MQSRFTMINESFLCLKCGKEVPKARATARDHCPFCLHSLHVDQLPGDRAADCGGFLKPVGYDYRAAGDIKIIFRCEKCGIEKRNRAYLKDPAPDNWEGLLALGDSLVPRL